MSFRICDRHLKQEDVVMTTTDIDQEREDRIADEAIVDCYDEEEQAMGWYYYLDDKIAVPFTGKCISKRSTSPLLLDEEVEVVGMAAANVCEYEMFVTVQWQGRTLDVPLVQVEVVDGDEDTQEAVEDWHYWVGKM